MFLHTENLPDKTWLRSWNKGNAGDKVEMEKCFGVQKEVERGRERERAAVPYIYGLQYQSEEFPLSQTHIQLEYS